MSHSLEPLSPGALFDLTGRRAVVLGGTGVLGGLFSMALAMAGAEVTVMGRSQARGKAVVDEIVRHDGAASFAPLDVRSSASILEAARSTEASGGADVLVNVFGINDATPFEDVTHEDWQGVLDVNLTAVFQVCQAFKASLSQRVGSGSVINVSSASSGPPLTRVMAYGVSKAGLNNLTQYLATELASSGIRVNAILPGFFPAEQNRALLTPGRVTSITNHTPLRRLGEPEELAGALLWLASHRASSFVTGSLVRVDGGFSAMTI
jgi:NAD(P)-dependent dehydrogenase (short-subunit alcohol dehydrogenase family)